MIKRLKQNNYDGTQGPTFEYIVAQTVVTTYFGNWNFA